MFEFETEGGTASVDKSGEKSDVRRDQKGKMLDERLPKYFVKRSEEARQQTSSALSGADDMSSTSILKPRSVRSRPLSSVGASREGFSDLVEVTNSVRSSADIILDNDSAFTLTGVANEFRRSDEIKRHGLSLRSKLIFCGPPGCGKSLCAEVVAAELQMPLVVARLDAIIASHLGETAGNLRKVFDIAKDRSVVLFLDEFDAIARARSDATEHSEIRRVVNSLLMMIDRFEGRSILIAATNLEQSIDRAIWRRFDEVIVFKKPTVPQIRMLLRIKTRNFPTAFDVSKYAERFRGMSFAQVERTCLSAIRSSILLKEKAIAENVFKSALEHEIKRASVETDILAK
ncbi:AAA family ATPase [Sphingorhabdus sp.]|jgi:SpoVK/Ycf46/Vps4 family AAA+-type ATPase|uniref:AAA family ATPase n=1 Tax=Sphingorhabdus sp. TaxID=1902408 RepID=UPI0037CAFC4E